MTNLLIDNGRVNCPHHGDLDIDHCVGCPDQRDIRYEGGELFLVCTARRHARSYHPLSI